MKFKNILLENKLALRIKKNITWKLFIITALVFTVFISSTLIFQSVFFGKFYIAQKKSSLQNKVEKFKQKYNKLENGYDVIELMKQFEENNNSKIVIVDKHGTIKFITNQNNRGYDEARIKIINDIILQLSINSNILNEMINQNESVTFVTDIRIDGIKSIVSAVPDSKKGEIIFALISLQPVREASSVIKQFYVYFYIAAIVIIILLSLIYTKMVSKPLVKMNSIAKKIASLDFSEKCDIKSEDEIGNLSNTLNFLSCNLNKALTSLKEANKKLEYDIEKEQKLERLRKDFINAVSHELKTPISLIGGYAEGLKDGIFESEKKDYYIDIIIDESKKMNNLVNDMLNLSHLESGNFKLNREKFYIDELINSVVNEFSVIMENKDITFESNILKKIPVYADWDMIEQVITNFLTNAIRYTASGGKIFFSTEKKDDYVIVSVENTGSHIPENEIDKVWTNFYKVDKSRSRKLGGTGLGLAIVKNILTLHNYDYGVKNTEVGVKFYFTMDIMDK
ncbi:two-component sensor histidine kinase [Clostridium sp. cel8]|jgi:two-component system, OmpR family, sensor histidine kinase VanS|uniref:HAMP domain-containing sensor histidine kinase n=1 Tax=unclassified Clostridium TaxID=2614128 RepID=UPI0015F55D00|nr:HAMP domain-containing sensor histidine kinase [Clostridium sp. cel8]MBA5850286.1 two-component sensor histidine kinase [Clostridium sp. cel8]